MDINAMVIDVLEEAFDPKAHFTRRFKKYGTTKSGRVRGKANARSNIKAYELGKKHGERSMFQKFNERLTSHLNRS